MARKKKKDERGRIRRAFEGIQEDTMRGIVAVFLFVLSAVLILAALEKAGVIGDVVYRGLDYLLGVGYFILPLLFVLIALALLRANEAIFPTTKTIAAVLFFVASLGCISLVLEGEGGLLGSLIAGPLRSLFDIYASLLLLGAFIAVALLILFDARIPTPTFADLKNRFRRDNTEEVEEDATDEEPEEEEEYEVEGDEEEDYEEDTEEDEVPDEAPEEERTGIFGRKKKAAAFITPYTPPPLSLLSKDKGKPGYGDIKANANLIKRTLQNFGIDVEMDEVSVGPSVTRYALKPAEGVRLSKIVSLQNNLELALAASPVRIEAPIPGRSLVGIEVPNVTKSTVGLGTLLGTKEFRESEKSLLTPLGKGISGEYHFANIAKMPHLLIAGATGSGKSVTIHSIILSLLYRNSPEMLRFIMVDPKRVELTLYKQIPHQLTPVITDAKKAILALKWAAKEMDRRYDILEAEQVRDIESYHKNVVAPARAKHEKKKSDEEGDDMPEAMPYIVIVIDELADIMSSYPRELEAAIVRLAQMSRAVGIHLILSTQRPSVNVITGLIKANIPARIALQVSSQVDSRTILDAGGAERLLGAGDMLYVSGEMSKPQRLQSAFVSEDELKRVTTYLSENYDALPADEVSLSGDSENGGLAQSGNAIFESALADEESEDEDELYEEAREIVVKTGKASTSYLQRKLRVGYARAARLMDILEERGVVGPAEGSKPREVLERDESEADHDEADN